MNPQMLKCSAALAGFTGFCLDAQLALGPSTGRRGDGNSCIDSQLANVLGVFTTMVHRSGLRGRRTMTTGAFLLALDRPQPCRGKQRFFPV